MKPVFTKIKNPQSNYTMEWLQELIYNVVFTKDIDTN